MAFPKLTKEEALKLECARIGCNAVSAQQLYDFISANPAKKNLKRK